MYAGRVANLVGQNFNSKYPASGKANRRKIAKNDIQTLMSNIRIAVSCCEFNVLLKSGVEEEIRENRNKMPRRKLVK